MRSACTDRYHQWLLKSLGGSILHCTADATAKTYLRDIPGIVQRIKYGRQGLPLLMPYVLNLLQR